jgi:ribosomal protein S18 acetylase RimI-like enzyme
MVCCFTVISQRCNHSTVGTTNIFVQIFRFMVWLKVVGLVSPFSVGERWTNSNTITSNSIQATSATSATLYSTSSTISSYYNKPDEATATGSSRTTTTNSGTKTIIRLRTATLQDVETISTMLASASLPTNDGGTSMTSWWNQNFHFLKAKSSYHKQISKRLRAIDEARKHLQSLKASNNEHNKISKQRYLWVSNSFRDLFKQAVNTYCEYLYNKEECYWHNHNYIILSSMEESLLQHTMIVAEEMNSKEVVGFVEVAMFVPRPSLEQQQQNYQPTVMNLAVSRLHRRRGVASRLIVSAIRYIRQHWILTEAQQNVNGVTTSSGSQSIGLYVNIANTAAIALYQNHGFVKIKVNTHHYFKNEDEERLYLERPMSLALKIY